MSDRDKIIEQITKLLALAETSRGATIEEAATAAAKAQALLFRHNLTLAQVQAAGGDAEQDAIDMRQAELGGAGRGRRRVLLHHVAEANFCQTIAVRGESWNRLIGKPHNMDVAQYLYVYLVREIWACWKKRETQFRKRSRACYCYGCVVAIAETLQTQRRRDEAASADSRALVVREGQGLTQAMDRLVGKTQMRQHALPKSRSRAIDYGYLDGQHIEIRTGLPTEPNLPRLEQAAC